ncbi:MAG: lysine--tRNA ligase [Christensenellales bacterium]|jgi:lysyl-tRNA synthetase class 2
MTDQNDNQQKEDVNCTDNNDDLREILRIRREKLAELKEGGNDPFQITQFDKTHSSADIISSFEMLEGKNVKLAGRMVSKRVMGKASFSHIQDFDGRIQLYVRKDVLGDANYDQYKKLDIGDIIGAQGEVFRTNAGEISVKVSKITLLAKSLVPLPEKYHGLKDTDLRYRQRHVDLIVNPEVKKTFISRSKIIKYIREYLDNLGYLEVETPILMGTAGGAAARPFKTHHNTLDLDMYLRIATELHLKRLIVGGFEKVYEIGRIFRNEGMSIKHNPEFTTIELYQAYANLENMMTLCENLFYHCAVKLYNQSDIEYQGTRVDLKPPWCRLSMLNAVKQYTGADFSSCNDDEAQKVAKSIGLNIEANQTKGQLLYDAFETFVEEKLTGPVFITGYPVEVSPLAKKMKDSPWLTERFELFITGREIANAFAELNDPVDQRDRFMQQAKQRAQGDDEAHMMDEDYISALEYGLAPTGGMGIGIDRMVMLLTDSSSIRDVILFPTMKPKD